MGYLFLAFALISGSVKGYCGKKTSGYVQEYKDAMFTNFIRMIMCVVISFALLAVCGNAALLKVNSATVLTALLAGVTTSLFVVLWLISVRRGAYMMLDVFLMMGVTVPIILSNIFFNEQIKPNQLIGLAVLFAAVVIMCSYNNQIKQKMSVTSLILLIICGVANGFTDFSQKCYVKVVSNSNAAVFNFYTYLFSAVVLAAVYMCAKAKDVSGSKSEADVMRRVGVYVSIMSVCLFAYSYFKTLAAGLLPSAILYPLSQGASLILSSIMSMVLFKEKITLKCVIGLVLSFIGLVILNS